MRIVLLVALAVALSGCVPDAGVRRKMPDPPPSLVKDCGDLDAAKQSEKLSELLTTVTENYSKYHTCRIKVEEWTKWYTEQKEIFDKVR